MQSSSLNLDRFYFRGNNGCLLMPTLIIHSREDDAHSLRSVDLLERQLGSTVKEKLILDNSYHVVTVDYQKEKVAAEVTRFFQRFAENRSAAS